MSAGPLREHFQRLARYNRVVNGLLLEQCAQVPVEELVRERRGSFGSIWRTLNHVLLADRVWMDRFEDKPKTIQRVDETVCDDFAPFRAAREDEDARIERFVAGISDARLLGRLKYANLAGQSFEEPFATLLQHMFNHATHHRGQVHVLLSEVGLRPNFDMHRLIRGE